MKKVELTERPGPFFAGYRFPALEFKVADLSFKNLNPIWRALRNGDHETARNQATELNNSSEKFSNEQRSAIKVALAAAELQAGDLKKANRFAGRALDLYPKQFAASRILLSVLDRRQGFAAAFLQLLNLSLPKRVANWDEPLSKCEIHTALASWAWQLGEWDDVAEHLMRAYPKGLQEMPAPLREEWFRLSLYRGHPEDAAAAAALIMEHAPLENTDDLLQTIVQSGWTKEALPLYRDAYAKQPKSELLRRRLVALCIREGELDEARALATHGAIRLAA